MEGSFKTIKPLNQDQKKPKINFEGEAALESQRQPVSAKKEVRQEGKPRDLSVEVQKALPLMNDSGNWQKRKDGA